MQSPQPGITNPLLRWLAAAMGVGFVLGFLWWFENLVGFRSFFFSFNLHFLAMGAAHLLHRIFEPPLTSRTFEVAPWEQAIYRRFGVIGFMHALRQIGWTSATKNSLVFDGTRKTLAGYERATRESEHSHRWLFLLIGALVVYSVICGWWDAALWLGSMNVAFHFYPVMLQRTQRPRLQKMLAQHLRRMGNESARPV